MVNKKIMGTSIEIKMKLDINPVRNLMQGDTIKNINTERIITKNQVDREPIKKEIEVANIDSIAIIDNI